MPQSHLDQSLRIHGFFSADLMIDFCGSFNVANNINRCLLNNLTVSIDRI